MQITRQRVRPALDITTAEECPSCFGKGTIQPSLYLPTPRARSLAYLTDDLDKATSSCGVHPFVDAYIKNGLISTYRRWRMEFGRKFRIIPDQSL